MQVFNETQVPRIFHISRISDSETSDSIVDQGVDGNPARRQSCTKQASNDRPVVTGTGDTVRFSLDNHEAVGRKC